MKVLVVGGGGREHALCWKLAQSRHRPSLCCAPGNAGTGEIAENVPIAADRIDELVDFAARQRIDLTVVGPEEPLCAGVVDRFETRGLRIFGPCAAAARLEGDKGFAKQLMRECGVPTADARIFGPTEQELAQRRQAGLSQDEALPARLQRGYDMARTYVATRDAGLVVKACGLAKGKGVFVHPDPADALLTLERLMVKRELGAAGERVVVEEMLTGTEVSVMALVDGNNVYVLETAADYKRLGDGDTGPNTGGMGGYSPSDRIDDATLAAVERHVIVPILDGLRRQDIVYRGVLYVGLMLTAAGPKVLEFNCRFGDPETQVVLVRLQSDLIDVLGAALDGRLDQIDLQWDPRPAVCVVLASKGYPNEYATGRVITGLERSPGDHACVFHAGTVRRGDGVVTSGGRVLGATALGDTISQARTRAYDLARSMTFEGAVMRSDIAAP